MHTLYSSRGLRTYLSLAALAATVAANAAILTQNFSLPLVRTSTTRTVTLNKFDPTLGTLTSIDFSLTGTIQTDMKLANLSKTSTNNIVGTVAGSFSIVAGTTTYASGNVNIVHSGTYAKSLDGVTPDYTNNRGQIFPQDVASNTFTATTSLAVDKALMTGIAGSTIDFSVATNSNDTSTDSAGNAFFDTNTFGSASGYVRYNYTPVPEPASMAALGLGVVGFVRRRKAGRK